MHVLGKVIQTSARAEDTGSVPTASQAKTVRAAMDELFSKETSSQPSGPALAKQFQKERVATHANLFAFDNQIVQAVGVGFLRWVGLTAAAARKTELDALDLYSDEPPFGFLSMESDQGSDMFCLVFFPMHVLHIRLVMVPDMCHRLPNDAKLAMQENGMRIFVLLLIPIYNLLWGLWNSCRWAQEAAWAFQELGAFEFRVARWVFEYEFFSFSPSRITC